MNASTPLRKSPSRSWLSGMRHGGQRRAKHVQPYDRFVKVAELLEAAQTVWTVWQTIDLPGLPAHVKLVQERSPHRSLTVSVSALTDRRYYRSIASATTASTHAPESDIPAAADIVAAVATAEISANPPAASHDGPYPVLSRLFEVADRDFEEARAANLVPFTRAAKEPTREPALAERM